MNSCSSDKQKKLCRQISIDTDGEEDVDDANTIAQPNLDAKTDQVPTTDADGQESCKLMSNSIQ